MTVFSCRPEERNYLVGGVRSSQLSGDFAEPYSPVGTYALFLHKV